VNSETFCFSWCFLGRRILFYFFRDERLVYLETELKEGKKNGPVVRYFMDGACLIANDDEAIGVDLSCLSQDISGAINFALKWAFGEEFYSLDGKQLTLSNFNEQNSIRPIVEAQIALADEKERARKLDFAVSTLESDLDNTKSQNIKMLSQIESLQQQLKAQREDLNSRHFEQMTQILQRNNLFMAPDGTIHKADQ